MEWREEQREALAESAPENPTGTESGELSERDGAIMDCPLCDDEIFSRRVGNHLFSARWAEIFELVERQDET